MGEKRSKSAEVERLREVLIRMTAADALALGKRAGIAPSTLRKFRGRYVADMGADKYAALQRVVRREKAGS